MFVPTWMIPPVYHSLRRESIKNASSASEMGVQSVRSTWFEDCAVPKGAAPQTDQGQPHSGWRFTQGPKGFDLFHEKLGMHCLDVAHCTNCPWVRLYPDVGSSHTGLTVSNTHDFSVAAVSGEDDSELARHRRQGHIPFNPICLECAKGRSVFQHRRQR